MAGWHFERPAGPVGIGGGFAVRPWRLDDVAAIVAAVDGDAEIARWIAAIPQPYRSADAEAFVNSAIEAWNGNHGGAFAVVDEHDAPVGSVALDLTGHDAPCVGYWIAQHVRGQGLAKRAVRAVVQLAFDAVGADRVILYAQPDNLASRAVARRAGFSETATTRLSDELERIVYEQRRR